MKEIFFYILTLNVHLNPSISNSDICSILSRSDTNRNPKGHIFGKTSKEFNYCVDVNSVGKMVSDVGSIIYRLKVGVSTSL